MSAESLRFLVSAPRGLTDLLARELTALGATALGVIGGVIPAWPENYAKGWVSVEGDRIPLADALTGLNLALLAAAVYAALVQHDQDLADAIDAAADAAALQAIDVSAGW